MKKIILLSLAAFVMLSLHGCSKYSDNIGVIVHKVEKPEEAKILYSKIVSPSMVDGVLTAKVINTVETPEYETPEKIIIDTDCTFKHFLDNHRDDISICGTNKKSVMGKTVNNGVVNEKTVPVKNPTAYVTFSRPLANGHQTVDKLQILGDENGILYFDIKPYLSHTDDFKEPLAFSLSLSDTDKEIYKGVLSLEDIKKLKRYVVKNKTETPFVDATLKPLDN